VSSKLTGFSRFQILFTTQPMDMVVDDFYYPMLFGERLSLHCFGNEQWGGRGVVLAGSDKYKIRIYQK
jgi:hypothetical protein